MNKLQEVPGTPEVVFTLPSSLVSQGRDKAERTAETKDSPTKDSAGGGAGAHTVSATILKDGKGTVTVVGDRRPSWRLRVNNGSKVISSY